MPNTTRNEIWISKNLEFTVIGLYPYDISAKLRIDFSMNKDKYFVMCLVERTYILAEFDSLKHAEAGYDEVASEYKTWIVNPATF